MRFQITTSRSRRGLGSVSAPIGRCAGLLLTVRMCPRRRRISPASHPEERTLPDRLSLEARTGVRVRAPTLSLGPANRVRLITRRLWTAVLTSDVTPSVRECFYNSDGGLPSYAETDVRRSDVCSQPSSDKTDSNGRASLRVGALTSRVRYNPSHDYGTSLRQFVVALLRMTRAGAARSTTDRSPSPRCNEDRTHN